MSAFLDKIARTLLPGLCISEVLGSPLIAAMSGSSRKIRNITLQGLLPSPACVQFPPSLLYSTLQPPEAFLRCCGTARDTITRLK